MTNPQIEPWESKQANCRLDVESYLSQSRSLEPEEPKAPASSDEHETGDFTWQARHRWIAATSGCDSTLEDLVQKGLRLAKSKEIKAYLLLYPDMIDIVRTIGEDVLKRFPRPSQVALELYQDPEIEDEHLTIYVRQYVYDDDILDVIDEIRLQFRESRATSSGWIHITTDFERPM